LFTVPSDAVRAFKELDGTDLQGRLMHIIAGDEKRVGKDEDLEGKTLKQRREIERRKIAGRGGDWGTLFMNVTSSSKKLRLMLLARRSIIIIGDEIWCCKI
jgi:multiple RNA-binding domain-containing protein 1